MLLKRKWVLIVSIVVGAVGALVIGGIYVFFKPVDIAKDTEENLERRYNIDFNFKDFTNNGSTNSREMIFSGNGNEYIVSRYYDSDNSIKYNDNVLGFEYKDTIEKDVKGISSVLGEEIKIELDSESSHFPDNTNSSFSLENLLRDSDTVLNFNVISLSSWANSDIKKFSDIFYDSFGVKAKFKILVLDEFIDFEDFDSVMLSSESEDNKIFFSIQEGGNLGYINRE